MKLGKIIEALESVDPDKITRFGFGHPNSFRGCYGELTFDPVEYTTIGSMLDHAKSALNRPFTGYKGGEFTVYEDTEAWIGTWESPHDADRIGRTLVNYWIASDTGTEK